MLIKNSPFSPENSGKKNSLKNENLHHNKLTNNKGKVKNFPFWNWIKSTINPLQNLPIISGIYSSVNSDDKNSDRDLVQNSLGGFIYGGPFGAVAGFGNWLFNKIFDKTPSEFALDLTGISNIWKSGNSVNVKKKEMGGNNLVSPMLVGLNPKKHIDKEETISKENEFTELKNQNKFSLLDNNEKSANEAINSLILKDNTKKKYKKIVTGSKIQENSIETEQNTLLKQNNLYQTETQLKSDKTYKSLNFTYPQWSSENTKNLNKSKIKSYDFDDKLNIEKKYLNIDA